MGAKIDRIPKSVKMVVGNFLCFSAQSVILFVLYFLESFWFFSGWILYPINWIVDHVFDPSYYTTFLLDDGLSYCLVAAFYAWLWFLIWKLNVENGDRWFRSKIIVSEIPLLVGLYFVPKMPDLEAMVPYHPEPIFSAVVTAIILFPVYSVLIRKYLLHRQSADKARRKRKIILICSLMYALGIAIFVISWNIMHLIYHFQFVL